MYLNIDIIECQVKRSSYIKTLNINRNTRLIVNNLNECLFVKLCLNSVIDKLSQASNYTTYDNIFSHVANNRTFTCTQFHLHSFKYTLLNAWSIDNSLFPRNDSESSFHRTVNMDPFRLKFECLTANFVCAKFFQSATYTVALSTQFPSWECRWRRVPLPTPAYSLCRPRPLESNGVGIISPLCVRQVTYL